MTRFKKRSQGSQLGGRSKAAILKASASVVCVITHNLPDDMTLFYGSRVVPCKYREPVLSGCGVVVECSPDDASDGKYVAIVIAPAVLFKRTNHLLPDQIPVDVCLSGGVTYKGELLGCDFHYNLAAVRIQCDSPLRVATLKGVKDGFSSSINVSIGDDVPHQLPPLRPHSDLFKVNSKTKIMVVRRCYLSPYKLDVDHGGVGASSEYFNCREIYRVADTGYKGEDGGAVINYSGDVIGIMFYNAPFLPSNIISRWWSRYKTDKKFCRPCFGMNIINLSAASLSFLDVLLGKFPDISTGVYVTKVEKDTPAHNSGIRPKDIIVKCDGNVVRSKMEFFEKMWDNAGKAVNLNVLRVTEGEDGQVFNISMTVGETAPDSFYRWRLPICNRIVVEPSKSESDSGSDA